MRTAERRLNLMKLLCRRRHETMSKLASEFGVSMRTIQRDIDELTFLIPLYVKSGRYDGGVYVDENYTMYRMYMSSDEINLLDKVKKLTSDKLSKKENDLFDYIIESYTEPSVKKF